MSGFQALEPLPTGEVVLQTTVGDIHIELFAKQTPLASRNFLQHCLDGYYNDTIFHRVVPGFIIQGGDPTGTGNGGESSLENGVAFADEFHSRLKFNRRGLLGMANSGTKDENGSQFFFTLDKTPELDGKNTMFGRVEGDTIYNIMKMAEAELIDGTERPLYPAKLTGVDIVRNPFTDMVKHEVQPRNVLAPRTNKTSEKRKPKRKAGKNILSFGGEDEEDDILLAPAIKKPRFNPALVDRSPKPQSQATKPTTKTSDLQAESAPYQPRPDPEPEPVRARAVSPNPQESSVRRPVEHSRRSASAESGASDSDSGSGSEDEEATRPSKSQAFIDRTNEEIAKLKNSMKRTVPTTQQVATKPKTGLEAFIPATSTRGRKRGGAGAREKDANSALDMFNAFRAKLDDAVANDHSAAADTDPDALSSTKHVNGGSRQDITPTKMIPAAATTGADDDEAALCDLHFIANCQSCTRWADQALNGNGSADEGYDGGGWMSHSLSFAKDRLGKDLEWKRRNEEELLVIDPREKEKGLKLDGKPGRERDRAKRREWDEGQVKARIKI